MAATPYTGTLTFVGESGQPYVMPISGDDVAAAFVTFTKTGQKFWNAPETVYLTDIALSASGVDTTRIELFLNGADQNISWLDGTVLKSIQYPRVTRPIGIAQGAMIQFKQQAS